MRTLATGQRRPTWWARTLIALSVAALPRSVRTRYSEEFIADLHGMSRRAQAGYSLGAATHCAALRHAVSTGIHHSAAGSQAMITAGRRPLRCRFNTRHDWHTESTEDGARYLRCRCCGKDETGSVQRSGSAQVAGHAANLLASGGAGGGGL